MKKYIKDLQVLNKQILTTEYFTIELISNEKLPEILPGQFAEVEIKGNNTTFLRRPLSIHDVDYKKNTIVFLVQIVGNATKRLSNITIGDYLSVIFPLGKGFSMLSNKKNLLIGGGCGIAPLLYLARCLNKNGNDVTTLIGVRTNKQIIEVENYKQFGSVYITTEDGSFGEKGYVVNSYLFNKLNDFDKIYTCGPEVMMKAIAKRTHIANVDCEVSLENTMACGIGACLCCVTETTEGNKCVCSEGPVFNIKNLKWEI
ncbi:MAG: dihydroorotate dehydrogenase electron transfer subunit [Bacteroidetes bacterium CG02_land_8_20_14_3_00_31_25]|nr:dihydroorotate dehydrogenase electron transfer subunit [Bacteroidota bacterium]PIV58115.1 MAG: dihydroorotate dehydrogenase electron transfer subunit [Bacteroidetes bacterium CG02_land_8_20_14_3_00_31_25]